MGTHWSVTSILYLSPLCHGYSLECPDNPLFVSIVSWVLIGVSCQSSICLQYVMGTHWECPDNRQFVSSMSWVLIGSVLTIVNLSPVCHGYSLGVSCQSSICLQYVMGTHWSVLSILYLSPVCHGYSLGVS